MQTAVVNSTCCAGVPGVGKLLMVVVVFCCCRDVRLYILLSVVGPWLIIVGSVLSAADVVCCMLFVAGCLLWRLVVGS